MSSDEQPPRENTRHLDTQRRSECHGVVKPETQEPTEGPLTCAGSTCPRMPWGKLTVSPLLLTSRMMPRMRMPTLTFCGWGAA